MIPIATPQDSPESMRYKYLAYMVVRDALGFYFGIPKFFATFDKQAIIDDRVIQKGKHSVLSVQKEQRYRKLITKVVNNRISDLQEDYKNAHEILFNDNIWLQLLDLNPGTFQQLIKDLPDAVTSKLAVVPNWKDRDEELRRPYQQVEYNSQNLKFK